MIATKTPIAQVVTSARPQNPPEREATEAFAKYLDRVLDQVIQCSPTPTAPGAVPKENDHV